MIFKVSKIPSCVTDLCRVSDETKFFYFLLLPQIDIDPNSGIFITLNPAGKGYGGRQKLPDNLKQLFRPVAMSRPDNEQIAEVILFSEGFKEGKSLGRKLVAIFNLSKELLTPQQHYDWGLRALKTVLRGSGNLLQIARRQRSNSNSNGKRKCRDLFIPTVTEMLSYIAWPLNLNMGKGFTNVTQYSASLNSPKSFTGFGLGHGHVVG